MRLKQGTIINSGLPKGQKARSDFPRFGLPQYANRFPENIHEKTFTVSINNGQPHTLEFDQLKLTKISIVADFHCVTTWSYVGLQWRGVAFKEFYLHKIKPLMSDAESIAGCVFTAQDGAKVSLLMDDLMQDDVLVADSLDGEPLSIAHGAPLRLVVPAHYGYKNLKHLSRIDFHTTLPVIKRGVSAFLEHPRARVAREERGRWVAGWILRRLYRPLIAGTVRDFRAALERELKNRSSKG